jgi:sugar O-acyltransferase (sialic acid O-acetyltransferase NeuD family)
LDKKRYLLGAGGHACVLVDILKQNEQPLSGIFSPDIDIEREILSDIPFFDNEDDIFKEQPKLVQIINGIGSMPGSRLRKLVQQKFSEKGYFFQQVISHMAIVSDFAKLGEGVQVMPGAIIQAGAVIGDHSIINTGAIIEHDCIIGEHNHIAPGVTLSGQVKTGNYVHIGTGANVIQGISIADNVLIGSGANVTKSVPYEHIVFGPRAEIKMKRVNNES